MYRQTDGVAMGSSLGPVLANICVGYYEARLFQNIQKPISYFRYVDDIFIPHINSFDRKVFYNEISNLHLSLKFTFEKETDMSLLFLDVLLRRTLTLYKCMFTANQHLVVSTSLRILSVRNHKR